MSISLSPGLPSERRFGFFFTTIFALLGIYHFFKSWNQSVSIFLLAISLVIGAVTLFAPWLLVPFNKAWFFLGKILGKVVNAIVLGILFFGLLTPVAIFTRLCRRDVLRLKRHETSSFWVGRTPSGPASDSFKNQF